jgi:hypothetical protein
MTYQLGRGFGKPVALMQEGSNRLLSSKGYVNPAMWRADEMNQLVMQCRPCFGRK